MSMAITPPGGPGGFEPPARAGATQPNTGQTFSVETAPKIPEPVNTGIAAAAQRYEELRRQGRELRFRVGDSGNIVVDVCDLEGKVLRTVPSETALDIIGGAPAE